ncbi:MAG: DNA polymerase I [Selenomonadaceae bacterium]|nr:DNA polymerase I [Selenomonadaceae bacterium]
MKLAILDGSSLLYRAFYALPLLSTAGGIYTNAIVGVYNMLTKLLKEESPDGVIIAFDKSKETFRKKKYDKYKGTRKPTPDELKMQIPMFREFAAVHGIKFIEIEGYEADDIIGTLATKAEAAGHEAIVVTGDRDALQLVRPNLKVFFTKKGISDIKIYDEEAFREEYGMEPIRLLDLKGLMGDSSDNIPGVSGVGEKTALKLMREYGSLENVYANIDNISGKKLKENLINCKEQAFLSKELATICLETPNLNFEPNNYGIKPDFAAMREFCVKYELQKVWQTFEKNFGKNLANSDDAPLTLNFDGTADSKVSSGLLSDSPKIASPELSLEYEFIDSVEELESYFADEPITLGLETTGRNVDMDVLGIMLKTSSKTGYIVADSLIYSKAIELLKSTKEIWVYDKKNLYHAGFSYLSNVTDIFLGAYLLHPEAEGKIERIAKSMLPGVFVPEKLKDPKQILTLEVTIVQQIGRKVLGELKEYDLLSLYEEMEIPLIDVLYGMERAGVFLNREKLGAESVRIARDIEKLENDIYSLAGETFNLNSPKQLGDILFEKLGLPASKKTKKGYSTNAEILEGLKQHHPIIEKILSYRMLSKLKSTYLDSLGALVSKRTGRLHTTFHQKITATGRLSSSDPNLQNIPVRREEGRAIRALFIPSGGYDLLLSADYSQIELRILAHLSEDKGMIDAFLAGDDIHRRTASEVFNVPFDEVTDEMRRRAKAVNFGIVYGISDFGLSRDLGITKKEAKEYIEAYFARYTGIKKFIDETIKIAKERGYVKTMFNRRRALPEISSANYNIRSNAERMAMNTPIQGTAADIIKLAMIKTDRALKEAGLKSRILLQVHDELVIETVETEAQRVSEIVKDAMETVVKLRVPLTVDVHTGKNWAEAK